MLTKVAVSYDSYLSYTIKKLTTMIEPAFLILLGCVVGCIMLSLILPMFDMIKVLRR